MLQSVKIAGYAPNPNSTDTRNTVSTSIIEPSSVMGTLDSKTTHYLINVQAQGVMVTFDGSDPSASNGHLFNANYQEFWTKQMVAKARWIRSGASDATLHVSPFSYC